MNIISSKDNKLIKQAASLSEKKYRDQLGQYIIEGPNPVLEAFMQGGRPRFIFLRAGAESPEIQQIIQLAETAASAVYELTGDVYSRIAQTDTPQGVIAVMDKHLYGAIDFFKIVGQKNILVLDRIQDPGNMGTLLRTAEAMGFGGAIIVKGSVDVYSPKVVRAAAGSILRFPLYFASDANHALKMLKDNEKHAYSAVMRSENPCNTCDLAENSAIIIGNEGGGVSDEFINETDTICIPMHGPTESLNAALAGAMLMYEALRQTLV